MRLVRYRPPPRRRRPRRRWGYFPGATVCATHRPPDTRACDMRAAGPTEGNRKHHPKAAPPESSEWNLAVRVLSRPQKMVFDCVYGRPEGGCDKLNYRQTATAQNYTTSFSKCHFRAMQAPVARRLL